MFMIPYSPVTLQDEQHGFVGISLYTFALLPHTDTEKDRVACQRVRDFYFGWYVIHSDVGCYTM